MLFRLFELSECLSPSRQTPLGGCGKRRLTNDALGILYPAASLASPMLLGVRGAFWNAQMLFPLITLAVGQVTTRDSVSVMPEDGSAANTWTLVEPLTGSE